MYCMTCNFSNWVLSGAHKGKERSTTIYWKPNCAALAPRHDVYRCMCMHDWRTHRMAESLALGSSKKCLQDKAYPFVAEERTFRTSWSNSSMSSSSSYTCLTFLFVSLLSFALGFSWAWAADAIVVSRLLTWFSVFALKWSLGSTTTTLGTFYTISPFCRSWRQNCCTAIQKLPNMGVFEMHKAAEFGFG